MATAATHHVRAGHKLLWILALLLVTVSNQAAGASAWPLGHFQYDVSRRAQPIGVHTVTVTPEDEQVVVEMTEWIDVQGWYGSYCHRVKRREVWSTAKLLRYDSALVGSCSGLVWGWDQVRPRKSCVWASDHTPIYVSAHQTKGQLRIARQNLPAGATTLEAPDTTFSANFLNPLLRQESLVRLLDPITGEPRTMTIRSRGTEVLSLQGESVETQTYQYTYLDDRTDTYDVWYDRDGILVRMSNRKDEVTFTLLPMAGSPAQIEPPVTNEACSHAFPPLAGLYGAES